MTETLYKILNEDGSCYHGGTGAWPLPRGKRPGKWLQVDGEIVPCRRGLHVCRIGDLFDWFGPAIWTVEATGVVVEHGNKLAVARARLLQRTPWSPMTARLFAADCAQRGLPLFERERPGDSRPRNCIAIARRHARGEATAAAMDAARDAAMDAARDAAWDAAWAAAMAAARAAGAAERAWQTERLRQYLTGEVS